MSADHLTTEDKNLRGMRMVNLYLDVFTGIKERVIEPPSGSCVCPSRWPISVTECVWDCSAVRICSAPCSFQRNVRKTVPYTPKPNTVSISHANTQPPCFYCCQISSICFLYFLNVMCRVLQRITMRRKEKWGVPVWARALRWVRWLDRPGAGRKERQSLFRRNDAPLLLDIRSRSLRRSAVNIMLLLLGCKMIRMKRVRCVFTIINKWPLFKSDIVILPTSVMLWVCSANKCMTFIILEF